MGPRKPTVSRPTHVRKLTAADRCSPPFATRRGLDPPGSAVREPLASRSRPALDDDHDPDRFRRRSSGRGIVRPPIPQFSDRGLCLWLGCLVDAASNALAQSLLVVRQPTRLDLDCRIALTPPQRSSPVLAAQVIELILVVRALDALEFGPCVATRTPATDALVALQQRPIERLQCTGSLAANSSRSRPS
jgi:hypothetical protein